MSDLISRQAAIRAVRELYIQSPKINNDIAYDMAIDQAHDALINLPSVESEIAKEISKDAADVMESVVRIARALAEILENEDGRKWLIGMKNE